MRFLVRALILIALLAPMPGHAAEEISLPQSDGSHRKMGGVGDRAKTSSEIDSLLAGERLQGSATNSYLVVRQEATATIITGTTAVTLGGGMPGDTHLMMLHIHTALTGTCVIEGFRDPAGNAETYILPAATIGKIDFMGAINYSGALAVTCSNAGDNKKVIAMWRPR